MHCARRRSQPRCSSPAPAALANDRDLRGTPVPAAACVEVGRSGPIVNPWFLAYFGIGNAGARLTLRCPLPVNNVELSGAGNDNDISKFRVYYHDGDGFAAGTYLQVQIVRMILNAGVPTLTPVCSWHSNVDGTGATTPVTATKTCAHDLTAGAFYHLAVILDSAGTFATFLGVDFPS